MRTCPRESLTYRITRLMHILSLSNSVLNAVGFDAVYVQFYNNYCGLNNYNNVNDWNFATWYAIYQAPLLVC